MHSHRSATTRSKLRHDDYVGCARVSSISRGLNQQWRPPCIFGRHNGQKADYDLPDNQQVLKIAYNNLITSVNRKKSIVMLHQRDIVLCEIKAYCNICMKAIMRL